MAPIALSAQRRITIDTIPSCLRCKIELKKVGAFGDNDAEVTTLWNIERGRDGTLFGAPTQFNTVRAIRPDKSLVKIGRVGRGPGEFQQVYEMVIWRDSLFVNDHERGQIRVYSPGLEYVRSFPTGPYCHPMRILRSGNVAIACDSREGTVRIYDRDGKTLHSFTYISGPSARSDESASPRARLRVVYPAGDSLFLFRPEFYELERRTQDGTVIDTIVRPSSLFDDKSPVGRSTEAHKARPRSAVIAVLVDSSGLLWTISHVAAKNWHPGPAPTTVGEISAYFDTVIDIIDLRSHRLVTSARFPGSLEGFAHVPTVFRARTTDDGLDIYDVYDVILRRK